MKKLIVTMALIIVTALSAANAQHTVTNVENEKIVTHSGGDEYNVVYKDADGRIFQEGLYLKIGDKFKPHGVWKLYDRNTFALVTTAKYNKGEQIWVETNINGQLVKFDQQDLKVKRLEERIAALEKKLGTIQD